jgi:hypothetical protein
MKILTRKIAKTEAAFVCPDSPCTVEALELDWID